MAVIAHIDSDANLVLAVQAGDTDAYAELFRRHYPAVRRACARRLRDVTEADEIAQAAFVRALERIDRCGGERRFGAWVQVIAQRLCIDTLRTRARITPHEQPVMGDVELGPNAPEDRVLELDRAAALRAALSTLPPRQRDVVVARDVEERRPPEIAAALGLSLGAVDSLLLRARRRLAGAYRSATGEQGITTTASSAAVAGSTIAAGNRGLVDAIVNGVRAVRDAALHAPAAVASAPAATAASPVARRAAAAAVAAGLSLAGVGGATAPGVPATPDVPVPVTTVPVPLPELAPPAPERPDLLSLVPPPSPLPSAPSAPTATVPAQPAPSTVPSAAAAPAVAGVDALTQLVTGLTTSTATAVGGLADTRLPIPPVG